MSRISRLVLPGAALLGGLFVATSLQPATAQTASQDIGAALPPDFRGRITYQGNFSGRRTVPARAPRRLDLRSILNAAVGGQTTDFAGPLTMEIEYDGSVVRATYVADGTRSAFTGTRTGTSCRVIESGDGGVGLFRCDRTAFNGIFESAPRARVRYRTNVEAHATRLVDTAREERERQMAAEAARQRAQIAAAVRAENDRVAYGNGPLARRMDAIAEIDSRTWVAYSYTPGSMTNVHRENVRDARNYTAVGNFRYGQGSPGSLRAQVRDGAFSCLQFGNEPQCRPIGQPPSHDFLTGLLRGVIEDAVLGPDR